jgi:hypothetical protein
VISDLWLICIELVEGGDFILCGIKFIPELSDIEELEKKGIVYIRQRKAFYRESQQRRLNGIKQSKAAPDS